MPVSPNAYLAIVYFPTAVRLDPVSGRVFSYEDSRFIEPAIESSANDKAKITLARLKLKTLSLKSSLSADEEVTRDALQLLVKQFEVPSKPLPGQPQAAINLQQIMLVEGTNFVPKRAWDAIKRIDSQESTISHLSSSGALFIVETSPNGTAAPKRSSLDFERLDDLRLIVDNCSDVQWLNRSRDHDITRSQGSIIHDNVLERLEYLARKFNKQEGQRKVALV